jgi:hypothetical protein
MLNKALILRDINLSPELKELLLLNITEVNGLFLLDPSQLCLTLKDWKLWEQILKNATMYNQYNICPICGQTAHEQHHALISRGDVRGMPRNKAHQIIHHSYNVLGVCQDCHRKCTRESAFTALSRMWGSEKIREWHNSRPFKSTFRRI